MPTPPGKPANIMNLAEEIKKLAELREKGILSPAEFEQAKQKLLGQQPPRQQGRPQGFSFEDRSQESIGKAANRYVSFQIVMAVVGVVLFLIIGGPIMCSAQSPLRGAPSFPGTPSFPSPR